MEIGSKGRNVAGCLEIQLGHLGVVTSIKPRNEEKKYGWWRSPANTFIQLFFSACVSLCWALKTL